MDDFIYNLILFILGVLFFVALAFLVAALGFGDQMAKDISSGISNILK